MSVQLELPLAKTQSKLSNWQRLAAGWPGWLPFGLTGLVYGLTAAAGLTYQHGGEDGGDLATAIGLGGVPHPTGYPLYMLVSRLFLLLPVEPARALNLASAWWGALAAGGIGLATAELSGRFLSHKTFQDRLSLKLAGCLAGLGLGLAPLVWSQALITEVYSFNLALTALVLLALGYYRPAVRGAGWLGLSAGLLVGHHRTGLFTLIGVALFIWLAGLRPNRRDFLKMFIGLGLGALVPYSYLLLVGGQVPAANWLDPGLANLAGFWQEFSGAQYQPLLLAAPLSQSLSRLSAIGALLFQNFGLTGLLLGWLGLILAWMSKASRPLAGLCCLTAGLHLLFSAVYAAENSQVYLIPGLAMWAILSGFGLAWLGQQSRFGRPILVALLLVALVGPLVSLVANYKTLDASQDRQAEEWAAAQLQAAPDRAILVSYRDAATFSLWYGQYIQKRRPDLALVELRLIDSSWYQRNLARLYPDLKLTASPAASENPLSKTVIDWQSRLDAIQLANPNRPIVLVDDPQANP